jgi:hypothetical protein
VDPLEQVWTCREDTLYRRLFGSPSRGIFPLEHDMFAQLDSGRFDFLHIVGITEQERDYAKRTARTSWSRHCGGTAPTP